MLFENNSWVGNTGANRARTTTRTKASFAVSPALPRPRMARFFWELAPFFLYAFLQFFMEMAFYLPGSVAHAMLLRLPFGHLPCFLYAHISFFFLSFRFPLFFASRQKGKGRAVRIIPVYRVSSRFIVIPKCRLSCRQDFGDSKQPGAVVAMLTLATRSNECYRFRVRYIFVCVCVVFARIERIMGEDEARAKNLAVAEKVVDVRQCWCSVCCAYSRCCHARVQLCRCCERVRCRLRSESGGGWQVGCGCTCLGTKCI